MKKARFSVCLLILTIFVSTAFAQKTEGWKIGEYLKNLPDEYKIYSGDFQVEPTAENTIIDVKNGYAAYYSGPIKYKDSYPVFEMAIFKKEDGGEMLVVSNMLSDPVCTFYHTFFVHKDGEFWIDVTKFVLPKFTEESFFESKAIAKEYRDANAKVGNSAELDLQFIIPRKGTAMQVKLAICDYVPDNFAETVNFQKFYEKSKTRGLIWDRPEGIFKLK